MMLISKLLLSARKFRNLIYIIDLFKRKSFFPSSQPVFGCQPMEGVIIEWPLNRLFNNVVTIIITSRTDVREINDDDDDDIQLLLLIFNR